MLANIAVVVVTYNPEMETFDNILSYYDFFEIIILVDNSEKTNDIFWNRFNAYNKIQIFQNGTNLGIGSALNIGAEAAYKKGYKWLLTMDQDSKFHKPQLENYLTCFKKISSSTIGVIGINYSTENQNKFTNEICRSEIADTVITSGSMVNLEAWKQINKFNEELFIDGVDDEFCFRLHQNKYKVIKLYNIQLNHRLGNNIQVRRWLIGPVVTRNIYNPVRMYYITRNYLHLSKKYGKDFPYKRADFMRTLRNKIKNNLLYNQDKKSVLLFILKGYLHYYKKQLGKLTV
jgi:rhamnosyltransferase